MNHEHDHSFRWWMLVLLVLAIVGIVFYMWSRSNSSGEPHHDV